MRADGREDDGLCLRPSQQPSDQPHMGTAFTPAKTSPASWDAFSDVDAFVDEVRAGPWRAPGRPVPGRSRRWSERRCARRSWRSGACASAACSGARSANYSVRHAVHTVCPVDPARPVAPPAQPLDPDLAAGLRRYSRTQRRHRRSCRSAPTCFGRGFDGGKKIKGIKIHLDKYGFPLAINVSAANQHDGKGIVPVLHQLAGFKGTALGDLSYRGKRLSKAGEALGITIQPSAGGHGGTFIPEGIRVERSLAWISRYRRLNTIFERTEGHLVAFIEIAFISILSRRLVRLGTQETST